MMISIFLLEYIIINDQVVTILKTGNSNYSLIIIMFTILLFTFGILNIKHTKPDADLSAPEVLLILFFINFVILAIFFIGIYYASLQQI